MVAAKWDGALAKAIELYPEPAPICESTSGVTDEVQPMTPYDLAGGFLVAALLVIFGSCLHFLSRYVSKSQKRISQKDQEATSSTSPRGAGENDNESTVLASAPVFLKELQGMENWFNFAFSACLWAKPSNSYPHGFAWPVLKLYISCFQVQKFNTCCTIPHLHLNLGRLIQTR